MAATQQHVGIAHVNVTDITFSDGTVQSTAATGGSGITALTGDVTAAGSGSVAATITNAVKSVGAVGASPNANAASIATTVLTLQPADGTNPGVLTAGAQSIGGAKTFTGAISASNLSGTNTGDQTLAGFADGLIFGDGSSGDLTSSGTTTLQADTFYNNVTLTGAGTIITNGWKLFIAGTLDISAAGANAIQWNGNAGATATTATGAAAGAILTGQSLGGAIAGGAGANGTTGAGANSGNISNTLIQNGGIGLGNGNATGGHGSASLGGNSGAMTAARNPWLVGYLTAEMYKKTGATANGAIAIIGINGGTGSPGGAGGGGSGTQSGGGGGGGGGGAGTMYVSARVIARGTNATAGIISCKGGNGGTGAPGQGTGGGGGAGGNGGGGGWLHLAYGSRTGSTITNGVDISGGDGGVGGNGVGSGATTGGFSGSSGGSAFASIFNVAAGTVTHYDVQAGATGNAPVGLTGGVLKTNTQRVNL